MLRLLYYNISCRFVHIVMDHDSDLRIRLGPQQKHKVPVTKRYRERSMY